MTIWDDIMDTPAEAESMRARAKIMRELRHHVETLGWSQPVAAGKLGISKRRVTELMGGRISEFSLGELSVLADRVDIDAHGPSVLSH